MCVVCCLFAVCCAYFVCMYRYLLFYLFRFLSVQEMSDVRKEKLGDSAKLQQFLRNVNEVTVIRI